MRKRVWSILLTACLLLGLLPTAAFAASVVTCPGGDSCAHEAAIGTVHYDTLKESIDALGTGETVTLLKDTTVPKGPSEKYVSYDLAENSTLDLNGKKLTIPYISAVFQGMNATIQNGTLDTNDCHYPLFIGNGEDTLITVRDVTVKGGINVYRAEVTLENVVADASSKKYHAVWADNGAAITIKSGTYTHGTDGSAALASGKGSSYITIEGGAFHGNIGVTGSPENKETYLSVRGGTFSADPSDYLAEGYIAVKKDEQMFEVKPAVAKVGDGENATYHLSLSNAIADAQDGDTVKLLQDLKDIGNIFLPADITLDGNGRTISGNSALSVHNDNHVTLDNIIFKNIHNDAGKLSAVYATGTFAGSLTITNCIFDSCDWDAIQITPGDGGKIAADIRITNNIFKHTNTAIGQERYIHIESDMDKETVFKVLVTDNKMYDDVKQEALGVYSVAEERVVSLSGNYIADTVTYPTCIANYDKKWIILNKLAYPMADENLSDRTDQVAIVGRDTWYANAYGSLAEALIAAGSTKTLTLVQNVKISESVQINNVERFDFNGKTITLNHGVSVKAPADIGAHLEAQSGYRVTKTGNETDGFTFTVEMIPSSGGGSSSGSSSGNKTETTTNPDGSTTTTVTRPDGSTTETTKHPDGSKEVVETKKDGTTTTTTTDRTGNKTETVVKPDGSSTTKVENKDGSSSATTVTESGKVEAEVQLPAGVVEQSVADKAPVALPMPEVPVTSDRERAPTITVDLPKDSSVKVEIPVEDVTAGTVAVLVKADGTEEVIKATVMTENGVVVTLSDGETVKIVDNAAHFVDVADTHWGAGAVDFATSRELFSGTSETTFSPEMDMTRAMILTVLARYEGVDTTTGSTWYEAGAAWAVEQGISDGTNLTASVTREQLALMLYRYAGSPACTGSMAGFPDSASVSGWAAQAMTWAVETGLISGTGAGTLEPQGTASRVEVAAMLSRFIAYTA